MGGLRRGRLDEVWTGVFVGRITVKGVQTGRSLKITELPLLPHQICPGIYTVDDIVSMSWLHCGLYSVHTCRGYTVALL